MSHNVMCMTRTLNEGTRAIPGLHIRDRSGNQRRPQGVVSDGEAEPMAISGRPYPAAVDTAVYTGSHRHGRF